MRARYVPVGAPKLSFSLAHALPRALPRKVWVIEDSDADAEAILYAAKAINFGASICVFADGNEVVELLLASERGGHPEADGPPAVILLDLNLPSIDGRALLLRLKATARWRKIPVLVLTTSDHPRDISFCYDTGANAYIVKPMDLEQLESILQAIDKFWLQWAVKP